MSGNQFDPKAVHVTEYLRPGGGPAGYLQNLMEQVQRIPDADKAISFLSLRDSHARVKPSPAVRFFRGAGDLFRSPSAKFLRKNRKYDFDLPAVKCHLQAKALISHAPFFTANYLNRRPPGQKLAIFNHSPVDSSLERLSGFELESGMKLPNREEMLNHMAEKEIGLYDRVDGIITPCLEALEGYFAYNPLLREKFEEILTKKKLHILPTGVPAMLASGSTPQLVADLKNWADQKIVVGYFGRYHPHKGFDLFADLASQMADNSRFVFISAGKASGLTPPSSHNYRDLGMLDKETELPHVLKCCDVVFVPNRFTFFDLIILEVMSAGIAIVTSATGGNRYISKESAGVVLLDNISAEAMRHSLVSRTREEWQRLGNSNREAYLREFTVERFAQRHIELARELISD